MNEKVVLITGAGSGIGRAAALGSQDRMDVKHVADAVVYMASFPLDANVQVVTVMATTMPYRGRG